MKILLLPPPIFCPLQPLKKVFCRATFCFVLTNSLSKRTITTKYNKCSGLNQQKLSLSEF